MKKENEKLFDAVIMGGREYTRGVRYGYVSESTGNKILRLYGMTVALTRPFGSSRVEAYVANPRCTNTTQTFLNDLALYMGFEGRWTRKGGELRYDANDMAIVDTAFGMY